MKKIVLKQRPVSVPGGQIENIQRAPEPPPPPELSPAVPTLPPPAPEAPEEPPTDFEGCMRWAVRARPPNGSLAVAQFWLNMAQAYATKEAADQVAILNDYVGANDEADGEEGEDKAPLRLADQITEGILGVVATLGLDQMLAQAVAQQKDKA